MYPVVQQQAWESVEAPAQPDPLERRRGLSEELGHRHRCRPTTLRLGRHDLALLLGPRQLPEPEAAQHRQQDQHRQARQPARPEAGPCPSLRLLPRCHRPMEPRVLKAAILLLLLAILASLFCALYFMLSDAGRSNRMVYALYARVVLSALALALIAWGFFTGQLHST